MISVRFTCVNNHSDVLKFKDMTEEEVKRLVGLIDGTSPMYMFPPGPDSSIGKCLTCRKPFTSKVFNGPNDNPVDSPQQTAPPPVA